MDYEYLERVKRGDLSAFSYFVNKYKDIAYTTAFRIVHNEEDAEEIVQDAFLKAFRSLFKFRKKSKFSTWFYKIVYNASISKKRKRNFDTININENITENISANMINNELNRLQQEEQTNIIKGALNKLTEKENTVLTLYYLNENSIEEINKITSLSRQNIKVILYRARKKLYKELNYLLRNELETIL